jgi:hypothetical protein
MIGKIFVFAGVLGGILMGFRNIILPTNSRGKYSTNFLTGIFIGIVFIFLLGLIVVFFSKGEII